VVPYPPGGGVDAMARVVAASTQTSAASARIAILLDANERMIPP